MDDTEVLVPCLEVGCGTLTAVIRDARSGHRVRLEGVEMLKLVGRTVCVALPVVSRSGPLFEVAIGDGRSVWVRPAPEPRDTAA